MTVALLLVVPALASAQGVDPRYRVEGYVLIGEGTYSEDSALHGVSHVGGGANVLLLKGFGVDSELEAMGRPGDRIILN
jgi:hypothetical protein